MFTLSKKELEMLELLWDAGEPLSRQEILDRAAARQSTWKPNSIHIIINSLIEKGAAQVSGFYLSSRKLGRNFEPAISKKEYALMQIQLALKNAQDLTGLDSAYILRELKSRTKGGNAE